MQKSKDSYEGKVESNEVWRGQKEVAVIIGTNNYNRKKVAVIIITMTWICVANPLSQLGTKE